MWKTYMSGCIRLDSKLKQNFKENVEQAINLVPLFDYKQTER